MEFDHGPFEVVLASKLLQFMRVLRYKMVLYHIRHVQQNQMTKTVHAHTFRMRVPFAYFCFTTFWFSLILSDLRLLPAVLVFGVAVIFAWCLYKQVLVVAVRMTKEAVAPRAEVEVAKEAVAPRAVMLEKDNEGVEARGLMQ
jgi:uncharacterized membrane protein